MTNQIPSPPSSGCAYPISGTGNSRSLGLSSLAGLCPHPNNSLINLLTAGYSHAPIPSLDGPHHVQPLQPHQILAIVDDVLRELDDEISDDDGASPAPPLPFAADASQ